MPGSQWRQSHWHAYLHARHINTVASQRVTSTRTDPRPLHTQFIVPSEFIRADQQIDAHTRAPGPNTWFDRGRPHNARARYHLKDCQPEHQNRPKREGRFTPSRGESASQSEWVCKNPFVHRLELNSAALLASWSTCVGPVDS